MDSIHVSNADKQSHAATFGIHETVYNLLSCFCEQFELDADTEFACFELFDCYFESLCHDVTQQRPFWIGFTDESYAELQLNSLAKDSLPDLLAIVSLCAKYFGFADWKDIYSNAYPRIFSQTKLRFSQTEFYRTEYKVFRYLNFQVSVCSTGSGCVHPKRAFLFQIKPSASYRLITDLLAIITLKLESVDIDSYAYDLMREIYLNKGEFERM